VVDLCDDNTAELVKQAVGDDPRFKIIINTERMGGTFNSTQHMKDFDILLDDIVVRIDGDDWLYDENVLQKLSDFYDKGNYWMTYGAFVCWDGEGDLEGAGIPFPQNTPYPDFVHKYKFYKRDTWRASHLRTFRGFLWYAYDDNDYYSHIDNKLAWHAGDLIEMFPLMEMCPKEKIGVCDFYTYVYNQSKSSAVRTAARETTDNAKYEVEIRTRKTYKEGLSGEKLPQINVFHEYVEFHNIPTKFTFCYDQSDGEYDMTLLIDNGILEYLNGSIVINRNVPIVARVGEHRDYYGKEVHAALLRNYDKFAAILTYDEELLKLPNAMRCNITEVSQFNIIDNPLPFPPRHNLRPYKSDIMETYDFPMQAFRLYPKTKKVSCVTSNKTTLPGHIQRMKFVNSINDRVEVFGRGIREIPSKLDALHPYMFNVAIENVVDTNAFTEKLTDCFLTGTVPIYYGCPNVGDFFNKDGIITFTTQEELDTILSELTEKKYFSMMDAIKENLQTALTYNINNDMAYENYYKQIIENYGNNRNI